MSTKRFSSQVRLTLLKGMEALGTSASNLASNAKIKVNEINLENRRREILTDFSLQAFELWQKGVEMPEPLSSMLTELSDIENRLSVLRAQKYAKVAPGEPAAESDPILADAGAVQEEVFSVEADKAPASEAENQPGEALAADRGAAPDSGASEATAADWDANAAGDGEDPTAQAKSRDGGEPPTNPENADA